MTFFFKGAGSATKDKPYVITLKCDSDSNIRDILTNSRSKLQRNIVTSANGSMSK